MTRLPAAEPAAAESQAGGSVAYLIGFNRKDRIVLGRLVVYCSSGQHIREPPRRHLARAVSPSLTSPFYRHKRHPASVRTYREARDLSEAGGR